MKKKYKSVSITSLQIMLLSFLFLSSCAGCKNFGDSNSDPITHNEFDELLNKHVSKEGIVDYEGFKSDKKALQVYLNKVSNTPPNDNWSREQQLAYWINAYNAYTVKLIVDNYPLESIQDLHPTLKIPGVNTIWHKKFFKIGDEKMSLGDIEHDILRKKFEEPRIHFAINCASKSCPKLLNKAYTAENIDKQLLSQTKAFLADGSRNNIEKNQVKVSKIFKWFEGDFTENGTLIDFLNKYSDTEINSDASIEYMEYDWSLNE